MLTHRLEGIREGARRMLAAALKAEVNSYLAEQRDERGRRLVLRKGHHGERTMATSAGPVQVKAPRVNDKRVDEATGGRMRYSSAIVPAWARTTPKISEVLPLLYLHGLSTGDFVPALEQFLGSTAGLSSATVSRLTAQWTDEHKAFQVRDLSRTDFVYVWADGVQLKVRLDQAKACVLVMMGVRADGSKELIESTFSTVRLRTKAARGAGSRAAAPAMTFKLIGSARDRWRAVNAPHLVALVRAGARFDKGRAR